MKSKRQILRIANWSITTVVVLYLALMLQPTLLFANHIEYRQCSIHSDKPIDKNITAVIDDALLRISKSEIYDTKLHFNIYICNSLWRFFVFAQGNMNAGAVTHYHLTGNIFLRPCDIANNQIVRPDKWKNSPHPFSFSDRPLSYYFAHEMTHKLEANYMGAFDFSKPTWLIEGYADYIGKDGNFDFEENLRLLHASAPELNPTLGLYRNYHLKVAYLLDKKQWRVEQLFANAPDEKLLTEEILRLNYESKNNSVRKL